MNITDYGAMVYTQIIVGLDTAPATMYIALCTQEPASNGLASNLVEPVDATGYERKSIDSADWALVSSDTPVVTNQPSYSWTPAVDWNSVGWVALCTDVGTDQVYCWTEITPFTGIAGRIYTMDSDTLTISVSGPIQAVV